MPALFCLAHQPQNLPPKQFQSRERTARSLAQSPLARSRHAHFSPGRMPQGPMSSPLMRPFVVLALPGMYLFYKYNQYKRKRKENAKRRLTERELQHLNGKIVSIDRS